MKKIVSLLLVLVLCSAFCSCGMNRQEDYDKANRYMNQGKYEEAIEIFSSLDDFQDSKQKKTYCEALSYCDIGDYEMAYNLLVQIPEYKDVAALERQIFFETRLFEGLSDYKTLLKNPESLSVQEVTFVPNLENADHPSCIVSASGQNGFGGYSTSYVVLSYDEEKNKYKHLGSCDSLNEDDYDTGYDSSTSEKMEYAVCVAINFLLEKDTIEDAVDVDRVNNIIKQQNFSQIKVIESQKYEDVA